MNRLFILCILVCISLSSWSQSVDYSFDHHDIGLSYGQFTTDQFKAFKSKILDEQLLDDRYVRDHLKGYGALFINYKRITKGGLFLWGVSAGMDRNSSQIFWVGQEIGTLERQYYTFAFQCDYRYVNSGMVQMYSGIGLGYAYVKESLDPSNEEQSVTHNSFNDFAYQINLIGLRLGRKYGGFLELGYGYKGIVNLGFSLQLY